MTKFVTHILCLLAANSVLAQTQPYQGGAGDGFAIGSMAETTLTNISLSVLYQGGAGDGFALSSIDITTLNNTDLSILYQGGAGDGFAYNAIDVTTLTNTDLGALFQGGAGDGFATLIAEPIVLDDFPRIKLAMKVILQGAALNPNAGETNLMRDTLRQTNSLPTTSPYGDGISCNPLVFSTGGSDGNGAISDDIVDWIFIELRHSTDASVVAISKSALLQRDGDIVDIDGISPLVIPYTPGDYYIAIRHRNHLGIMTANSTSLSQVTRTVNFLNSGFNTFGSHARVQLGNGKMALWSGDASNGGNVKFSGANNDSNTIKDKILSDAFNILGLLTFAASGYLNEDVDLNGTARFSGVQNDSNLIKDNVLAHPNNILGLSTFNITEQIPNN
ncbi:hypothetical protein [Winogradskyella sp.]|uniref:hypothetical protein n=1 Tax=Winogradskyella sp. TaxID=1883156 RepID=UPI003BAD2234